LFGRKDHLRVFNCVIEIVFSHSYFHKLKHDEIVSTRGLSRSL
jgi:hypothetical protein